MGFSKLLKSSSNVVPRILKFQSRLLVFNKHILETNMKRQLFADDGKNINNKYGNIYSLNTTIVRHEKTNSFYTT